MRLVIETGDVRRLSADTQNELIRHIAGPHFPEVREGRRLQAFVADNGRIAMKQLLNVSKEKDPRVLSFFQGVITRKLRRILGASEKRTYLIGWDYEPTKWNKAHTEIIDGGTNVTGKTLSALKAIFRNS